MRSVTLTIAAGIALAAAACADRDAGNNLSTDTNLAEDTALNDVLGANETAAVNDDAGFAAAIAASDLYEIESAELAADQASNADVKAFAQHLRTDHEKSTAELKSAAGTANITVTPALDSEKQAMLNRLRALSDAEFDREFVNQQKTAHQKALALLQSYANSGGNEALKTFAAKTATAVKGHLDHANTIKL